MPNRNKDNSYVHTSKASRATIGSHIVQDSRNAQRTNVHLGNKRGARRADRGMIDHVTPMTSTRESASHLRHRARQAGNFVLQDTGKKNLQTLLFLLVAILVGVFLVATVMRCAFAASINGKIALNDSAATAALVAPESKDQAYYALIAGEYSDSRQTYDGPNLINLVRVDPQNQIITLISIPSNTEVVLSDGNYHAISEAQTLGGDAELITAVSDLMGVDIAHYVKTDADGFKDIVDRFGGITVDVPEEVDDPDAGDIYIPAGEQTLNGEQALVLCRADNYSNSVGTRASNQMNVLNTLLQKVATKQGLGKMLTLDRIKKDFKTDMKVGELNSLLGAFKSLDGATIYAKCIPGSSSTQSNGVFYVVSTSNLEKMMESVNESGVPTDTEYVAIDPSTFSVQVMNGAGITGAATAISQKLEAAGFILDETTNADSYVYDETLVVYKDDDAKAAAEAVVDTLGYGRAVDASIYYSFDTDLLVIIGNDWKPEN